MSVSNLNDVMNAAPDYDGVYFIGTVVDNQDPTGQHRFKATVPGLYDEGDLPWIGFKRDSPFGNGSNWGTHGSPAIGSMVVIQLQNGSAMHPICEGFLTLSGHADPAFADPNSWGFRDPHGNLFVINGSEGTLSFTHQSGTVINIGSGGETSVVSPTSVSVNAPQVNATANQVTVDAPNSTFNGNVAINGTLTVDNSTGAGLAVFRGNLKIEGNLYDRNDTNFTTHRHPTPEGDSGPPYQGS